MTFIIAWLLSPIVLTILLIVQINKNSGLKKENTALQEKILELSAEKTKQLLSAPLSAHDTEAVTENIPEQPEIQPETPPQETVAKSTFADAEKAVPAAETAKPKSGVSTINIILILGALLISLSGCIFAVAAWEIMNTFFRAVILLSFSALFFGIHSFTERKLKLAQTGRVFYVLGSIFLPAAVAAAGALKVFGEYFSFGGNGRLLFLSALSLSICVPFFKGAHDYKSKPFAFISHFSFSAAASLAIFHFVPRADAAVLITAVYSLLVVLAEPIANRAYIRFFGEDNVFSAMYGYFSVSVAAILGVVSISVFSGETMNVITLIAFAVFSACFLTKASTGKNEAFSAITFALFLAISVFSGIRPNDAGGITCSIASIALIYTVLSAMGILPETLRKILKILAIIASAFAVLAAVTTDFDMYVNAKTPSWEFVISAGAVYVQMMILALRNKTPAFKAFSFAAMLWFVSQLALMTGLDTWRFAISFAALSAYFLIVRITPLQSRLYTAANDIILGVHAFFCTIACCIDGGNCCGLISSAMLIAAIFCIALSKKNTAAPAISAILTGSLMIPIIAEFERSNLVFPFSAASGDSAAAITVIIMCIAAAVLLFIPKAKAYAKAYGITTAVMLVILIIACMISESYNFIPTVAVTAYTVLYLAKSAFPNQKFSRVNLLNLSILLTAFFIGANLTEDSYIMCFPAAALLLIFAVYAIGIAFDAFENTGKHIGGFIWYAASILGGIMVFAGNDDSYTAVIVFGIVLAICSLLSSIYRRNTMNMIFPIFSVTVVLYTDGQFMTALALTVIFAAIGRILFSKKIAEKLYADVFSIGAFFPAIPCFALAESDLQSWFTIILLALAVLNLIRREHTSNVNKVIITISALSVFPLVWVRPFLISPDEFALQVNLIPVVLFCLIFRFIWKDNPQACDNLSFTAAIISLVVLFVDSLSSGDSFDAVFIGAVLFIMLAVSFIIKKKRWFVLAVVSMVVSAVLLSIEQRDNIAWLVYLAIAGAALITLGVVNELKKQQKRSGEETKLTRFMSDWTW